MFPIFLIQDCWWCSFQIFSHSTDIFYRLYWAASPVPKGQFENWETSHSDAHQHTEHFFRGLIWLNKKHRVPLTGCSCYGMFEVKELVPRTFVCLKKRITNTPSSCWVLLEQMMSKYILWCCGTPVGSKENQYWKRLLESLYSPDERDMDEYRETLSRAESFNFLYKPLLTPNVLPQMSIVGNTVYTRLIHSHTQDGG